jgi:aquaporin Z
VALAFGLTVLSGVYCFGPISGGHFNPAVTVGLWSGGRFPGSRVIPYIIAQVAGAIAGAAVLYLIASGKAGFSVADGFASNGYGAHSPGQYSMLACAVSEAVMTFMFVIVILGTTHKRAPVGFAGIAIGLTLTLIHLISIPVTNTSVNPAQYGAGAVRRRLGDRPALVLLGFPHTWSIGRGRPLPGAIRTSERGTAGYRNSMSSSLVGFRSSRP